MTLANNSRQRIFLFWLVYLTTLRPPLSFRARQFSSCSVDTPTIVPPSSALHLFIPPIWFALWYERANVVVFHCLTVFFQTQTFRWVYRSKQSVSGTFLFKSGQLSLCSEIKELGIAFLLMNTLLRFLLFSFKTEESFVPFTNYFLLALFFNSFTNHHLLVLEQDSLVCLGVLFWFPRSRCHPCLHSNKWSLDTESSQNCRPVCIVE